MVLGAGPEMSETHAWPGAGVSPIKKQRAPVTMAVRGRERRGQSGDTQSEACATKGREDEVAAHER